MPIVEQYLNALAHAREQHGERTIVVIEVGSFYEVYGTDETDSQLRCCSELLGFAIARKSKSDANSAYMSGAPVAAFAKHFDTLMEAHYTVVVINQEGDTTNTITRHVSRTLSIGCAMSEDVSVSATEQVLCCVLLYVDVRGHHEAHVGWHDNNRGETHLETVVAPSDDLTTLCEALHEVILSRTMQQIAFHTMNAHSNSDAAASDAFATHVTQLQRKWVALGALVKHKALDAVRDNFYLSRDFQQDFLDKDYAHHRSGFATIWEALGLTMTDRVCVATLVLMLRWLRNHDKALVDALNKPTSHQLTVVRTDENANAHTTTEYLTCYNELYTKLNLFEHPRNTRQMTYIDPTLSESDHAATTRYASVFNLLNATRTPMGKRLLQERLTRVTIDAHEMTARYDVVQSLLDTPDTMVELHEMLHSGDLERVYRRVALGKLHPSDLTRAVTWQGNLLNVLQLVTALGDTHTLHALLPRASFADELDAYQRTICETYDIDKCASEQLHTLKTNVFRRGVHPELDTMEDELNEHRRALDTLIDVLSKYMRRYVGTQQQQRENDNDDDGSSGSGAGAEVSESTKKTTKAKGGKKGGKKKNKKKPSKPPATTNLPTPDWFTIRYNDKDGYYLELTKKRNTDVLQPTLNVLLNTPTRKAKFHQETQCRFTIDKLTFKNTTNATRVCGDEFKTLTQMILSCESELVQHVRDTHTDTLTDLHARHHASIVQPLVTFTAKIDVAHTSAHLATKHGYVRPEVVPTSPEQPSFIDATQLRHPLIERLLVHQQKQEGYVPNDVHLSAEQSWLLYGVNSVGKSSLLKSIALGVLMAQAGLYVAANRFQFAPYTKLFARTGNDDNIHRAHSSFVKEMTEAAQIVKHADPHSLVIADELCASTELDSAVDIVGALLQHLHTRKSTYAFATHLFALQEQPYVQQLRDHGVLHNKHLQVTFEDDKLVFDRTLTDGLPVNRVYGALVADKVIRDEAFSRLLATAQQQQQQVRVRQTNRLTNRERKPDDVLGVVSSSVPSVPSVSSRCSSVSADSLVAPSRYNASMWNIRCEVCQRERETVHHLPLDTHHIREQQEADKATGLIEQRFHKNERHNLVQLCKTCHQAIDTGALTIDGWRTTSDGSELVFAWAVADEGRRCVRKKNKTSSSRYSDDTIRRAVAFYHAHKSISKTNRVVWREARVALKLSVSEKMFLRWINECPATTTAHADATA